MVCIFCIPSHITSRPSSLLNLKMLLTMYTGKGSGKGKTDKRLKKIDDEKRRLAESMLDASQNVGMSSATAQQTKKRKEAGVRLA